ncbi:MAG: HIT domain-containing protein [Deltaproteobacteria bacterium]|nr:HIT domain-containing protein [Deltaproteobacteria bacterium]
MTETLWAPWRMTYILGEDKTAGCIFCPDLGLPPRPEDMEERLILSIKDRTMVMMNKYPYINGHLLVSPRTHTGDLGGLTSEERADLLAEVDRAITILKQVMHPDGFNVGLNLGLVAGAGVEEHLHFHVVPRWKGDTNFMTVFADLRVIPEHFQQTYAKLRPLFD